MSETPEYSEKELREITNSIIQEKGIKQNLLNNKFKNHTMLDGKYVRDDWDDDAYIATLYDDVFLKLVEQEYRGLDYTFDVCLKECMGTLSWRREELIRERAMAIIDQHTYQNALALIEMSEAAIRKYQEKPDRLQLIGV